MPDSYNLGNLQNKKTIDPRKLTKLMIEKKVQVLLNEKGIPTKNEQVSKQLLHCRKINVVDGKYGGQALKKLDTEKQKYERKRICGKNRSFDAMSDT